MLSNWLLAEKADQFYANRSTTIKSQVKQATENTHLHITAICECRTSRIKTMCINLLQLLLWEGFGFRFWKLAAGICYHY